MAYEQPNSRAEGPSGIPIVVPVDICGLESCMLQKHGEVTETGAGKELSAYEACGGRGGDKFGVNTEGITRQGREGKKIQQKEELTPS